ncbi:MAG: Stp1/IreP family PP2C-type Ser/Thr phosphatase [Oscillospiraceae bacterium]|jgi:protein phosphatase|nr:Stp1/IreP family PP2C-type Ser/Thr phosphatase [Oscillospiraceae bacterium]
MAYFGLTDVGRQRKNNQDVFRIERVFGVTLLCVCDGMGGAASGEIASKLACDKLIAVADNHIAKAEPTIENIQTALRLGIADANRAVSDDARQHPERDGMGTTLVAAAITGDTAVVANIGDSRAYHLSGGAIRQITRDHSVVAELVERGEITPEQARIHPRRNLITRVLGSEPSDPTGDTPDLFTVPLSIGDMVLLCTDGLCGVLTDTVISETVTTAPDLESACRSLVDKTLARGAPDNVTIAIFKYDGRTE